MRRRRAGIVIEGFSSDTRIVFAEPIIVGLDLSLRGPAGCVIPPGWDGLDLSRIRMGRFGPGEIKKPEEKDQVVRNASIAADVAAFVRANASLATLFDDGRPRIHVYVEDYAYSAGNAGAHKLAEMRGVVKHFLYSDLLLTMEPVNISTGRKTLLQLVPRREKGGKKIDAKEFVERNVRRLKGETFYWTLDEIDAFCVANYGRAMLGLVHMSFPGF